MRVCDGNEGDLVQTADGQWWRVLRRAAGDWLYIKAAQGVPGSIPTDDIVVARVRARPGVVYRLAPTAPGFVACMEGS